MTYREQSEPGAPCPEILIPEPQLQVVEVELEKPTGPEPWTISGALKIVEDCWGPRCGKSVSN